MKLVNTGNVVLLYIFVACTNRATGTRTFFFHLKVAVEGETGLSVRCHQFRCFVWFLPCDNFETLESVQTGGWFWMAACGSPQPDSTVVVGYLRGKPMCTRASQCVCSDAAVAMIAGVSHVSCPDEGSECCEA